MLVELNTKELEMINAVRRAVSNGYGIKIVPVKEDIYYCLECGSRVKDIYDGYCIECSNTLGAGIMARVDE